MSILQKHNESIELFSQVNNLSEEKIMERKKISLIGCGQLGGTCIASLIYTNITANIVLIEPIKENFGNEKNLYESLSYCDGIKTPVQISCSNVICASAKSDICLIAFEHKDKNNKKETFSNSKLFENITNFNKYIPEIIKLSPNVILILLTYPYTFFTQICYKIAKIPKQRIIGLGTCLSTSQFRLLIAKKLNISPRQVEGYVIGFGIHNYKIPIWSTANISGVQLSSLIPLFGTEDDPLHLYHEIMSSKKERFKLQDPPRWTVGVLCAKICNAIIYDTKDIFTVPANMKGNYGITEKCFISVPCSIGKNGIHSIILLKLNLREQNQLKKVAKLSNSILTRYIFASTSDNNKTDLMNETC